MCAAQMPGQDSTNSLLSCNERTMNSYSARRLPRNMMDKSVPHIAQLPHVHMQPNLNNLVQNVVLNNMFQIVMTTFRVQILS